MSIISFSSSHEMRLGFSLLLLLFSLCGAMTTALNITALSSRNGYSVLECWQLASVPVDAMAAANYALGNTTVATWSTIKPRTTVGEAWAPHVQLSMILNGLIRITSPSPESANSSDSITSINSSENSLRPATTVAYIMPGTTKSSLLIAADLRSTSHITGHYTEFPSDEPTVLIQVPFMDNLAPEHIVLHDGPCL
ncbi:hypothetical protein QBC46DRAFT_391325 [Diplogelasinospora grovesii]|uniref:Uncharacterized protein n=1 Tax=Diplogelasinospora grovesii TaxID=303347 RepID=A0AAN6N4A5_9PEZI|nr:hypothetical protein QBC46DRAFT_391325 [Diplogelasinospora grovesii]